MPKLIITAKEKGDVIVQDPFPAEGLLTLTIPKGTTKELVVSKGQHQRMKYQLAALELNGMLTYDVEFEDFDTRSENADLEGLPNIDYVTTNTVAVAGQTGIDMFGPNIQGENEFASLVIGDAAYPDRSIEVTALLPGYQGNEISVEVVDTGGGGLSVAVAAKKITVDQGGSGSDATTVKAAIDGYAAAAALVTTALLGTGGDVVATQDEAYLEGGLGAGIFITCGGFPCTITAIDLTVSPPKITFDVPALAPIVAAQMVALQLRSGAKLYTLSLPTV